MEVAFPTLTTVVSEILKLSYYYKPKVSVSDNYNFFIPKISGA